MALLAEPKRKDKFGIDPRNTSWSNDDSKFGQRLMEKMGWEKGRGLGAKEDGMTEHIKASYKSDTRGLGCTPKDADAWIAHQDDFNELLKNLNAHHGENTQENAAKKSKVVDGQKRYYGKFSRGRVQTLRSTEDLDCIFGRRKTASEPTTPNTQSAVNSDDSNDGAEEHRHGLTTVTSTSSVQEYFAKKMAELKARKGTTSGQNSPAQQNRNNEELGGTDKPQAEEETAGKYGAVSFSYDDESTTDSKNDVDNKDKELPCRGWYLDWNINKAQANEEEKSRKKKKPERDEEGDELDIPHKKKKKEKCKMVTEPIGASVAIDDSENTNSGEKEKRKKDKRIKESCAVENVPVNDNVSNDDDEAMKRKEKKKRKRKLEIEDGMLFNESENADKGHGSDNNRKKKKRKLKDNERDRNDKDCGVGQRKEVNDKSSARLLLADGTESSSNKVPLEESTCEKVYKPENVKKKKRDRKCEVGTEEKEDKILMDGDGSDGMVKTKKMKKKKAKKVEDDKEGENNRSVSDQHHQNSKNSDLPVPSNSDGTKTSKSKLSKHEKKLQKKERKKQKKAAMQERGGVLSQWFPGSNVAKIKGYGIVDQVIAQPNSTGDGLLPLPAGLPKQEESKKEKSKR